jgi:hypothetical protein
MRSNKNSTNSDLRTTTLRLLSYCQQNGWAGYEPYDALNSRLFKTIPLLDTWFPRLVVTQVLKRSPLNFRPLLGIPPTQNPKGLGLFLSSLVFLDRAGVVSDASAVDQIVSRLVELRSPNTSRWCWGYNFPWQTRSVLVPRWRPNLVCTTFAASGLLDVYAQQPKQEYLEMAVSAAEYLLEDLYWRSGDSVCGFGYPLPEVHNQVHNANLLGASLFCRIYALTGEKKFLQPALDVTRYTVSQQRPDGGWAYGERSSQKWIDNFHTGFDLSALRSISLALETSEFDNSIANGFRFYRKHFFRADGAVGYFSDRFYPIDSHCFAQSIITLLDLAYLDAGNTELAHKVFAWSREHMWDDKKSFFYYRILRSCTIRTSYMRWTQAWMLLALSRLLEDQMSQTGNKSEGRVMTKVLPC